MKKLLFLLITVLTALAILSSCNADTGKSQETIDNNTTADVTSTEDPPAQEGSGGGIDWMYTECEYTIGFYMVEKSFADMPGEGAFEAWMDSLGINGQPDPEEYSVLAFIRHFNIAKEDFTAVNNQYEENAIYTDKQIESLYSDDPLLLARMFMNPDAFYVNGTIYTPRWIMDHSLEEIRAVGITDDMLRFVYHQLSYYGTDNDYYKKIKSLLDMLEVDVKYEVGFYAIADVFQEIPGWEAYEEWIYQNGYYDGKLNINEVNMLKFIQYFDISKDRFTVAAVTPPYYLADGPFFTLEKVDILYSGDKNLIAETFMAPEAINVNGEIYTPRWIAAHSIEEIKAAGITKEVLQSKYDEWIDTEKFAEDSEVCIKTKALLDNFN